MTLKSRNASFVEFVATLLSTELQVKYDDDEFFAAHHARYNGDRHKGERRGSREVR